MGQIGGPSDRIKLWFAIRAKDQDVNCTRWTLDGEDRPGCMFSVCVEGSAGVVALIRALYIWEGENSTSDDGSAADTVARTT